MTSSRWRSIVHVEALDRCAGETFRHAPDVWARIPDPMGQYVNGANWLMFCATPGIWGISVWGSPAPEAVRHLLGSVRDISRRWCMRWLLVDLSGLSQLDASVLELLVQERAGSIELEGARGCERRVMVRPQGLVGSIVVALFGMLRGGPSRVYDDLPTALGWLLEGADASASAAIIELCEREKGSDPLVTRLRAELARGASVDLETVAQRLGVSGRTLQRRLKEAKTSFQAEANAARFVEAQLRMALPCTSLTAIAFELGFGSGQNFSRWFRRLAGLTPSEWRRSRSPNGAARALPAVVPSGPLDG